VNPVWFRAGIPTVIMLLPRQLQPVVVCSTPALHAAASTVAAGLQCKRQTSNSVHITCWLGHLSRCWLLAACCPRFGACCCLCLLANTEHPHGPIAPQSTAPPSICSCNASRTCSFVNTAWCFSLPTVLITDQYGKGDRTG
jgi:hypothetical protein